MRRRPLGHDVVVAALLLLSCSDRVEKELAHDTPVEVQAPVHARIERRKIEVTQTAGCGCSGGMGGRGAVPLPSCEESRCSPKSTVEHRCTLVIEREKPAKESVFCDGETGAIELKVDPKGERFATGHGDTWMITAGGYAGQTSVAMNPERPGARLVVKDVDWAALPSAREIVRADLASSLRNAHYVDITPREAIAATFTNLERLAPEHLVEDLVMLATSDVGLKPCLTGGRTSWLDFYAKQSPALKAAVKDALAPGLESAEATANLHALHLLSAKEIVERTRPPRWLEDEARSELTRAAVLDAWSLTNEAAAAEWACKALAEKLPPLVEDAALLAVGRPMKKCEAVRTTVSRHCAQARRYVEDPSAVTWRTDDEQTPGEALFCTPAIGYYRANVAASPEFDEAAWRAQCFPKRDAAVVVDR